MARKTPITLATSSSSPEPAEAPETDPRVAAFLASHAGLQDGFTRNKEGLSIPGLAQDNREQLATLCGFLSSELQSRVARLPGGSGVRPFAVHVAPLATDNGRSLRLFKPSRKVSSTQAGRYGGSITFPAEIVDHAPALCLALDAAAIVVLSWQTGDSFTDKRGGQFKGRGASSCSALWAALGVPEDQLLPGVKNPEDWTERGGKAAPFQVRGLLPDFAHYSGAKLPGLKEARGKLRPVRAESSPQRRSWVAYVVDFFQARAAKVKPVNVTLSDPDDEQWSPRTVCVSTFRELPDGRLLHPVCNAFSGTAWTLAGGAAMAVKLSDFLAGAAPAATGTEG